MHLREGVTDGQTDGLMDTPSYGDATVHLKRHNDAATATITSNYCYNNKNKNDNNNNWSIHKS